MNLRRAAASAALLTGLSLLLMYVAWFLVIPSQGLSMDDMMNPLNVGNFAMTHRAAWTLGSISDSICGITIPFLTLALYRKFRSSQPAHAVVLGIFGIMASVLFFMAGAVSLLAPGAVARLANPAEAIALLGGIQQPVESAAICLIAISMWHTAQAARKSNAFNAVTLYSGYIGSLGMFMLPVSIVNAQAGMFFMFPGIVSIVYNLGLAQHFMSASKNKDLELATA